MYLPLLHLFARPSDRDTEQQQDVQHTNPSEENPIDQSCDGLLLGRLQA